MNVNTHQFNMKTHYFKNPIYTPYNNGSQIGKVNTKLTLIADDPTVYYVIFDSQENKINFYALLRLLIEFPPTMDV